MTFVGQPPRSTNLVQRATNIILRPTSEWQAIAAEPATVQSLFVGYAMILALIPPVCQFIGQVFIGIPLPMLGTTFHVPIVAGLINLVLGYLVNLAGVFVFGLVIDMLAPNFGGTRDRVSAMKVAVYSATPAWLAGVFGILPMIALLAIVGLYGIFLLYKGLEIVMRSPRERVTAYTAVTVVVMIVVWVVLFMIIGMVAMATGANPGAAMLMHPAGSTTTITTTQ